MVASVAGVDPVVVDKSVVVDAVVVDAVVVDAVVVDPVVVDEVLVDPVLVDPVVVDPVVVDPVGDDPVVVEPLDVEPGSGTGAALAGVPSVEPGVPHAVKIIGTTAISPKTIARCNLFAQRGNETTETS